MFFTFGGLAAYTHRRQEIPQHEDSGWIASRAEDRARSSLIHRSRSQPSQSDLRRTDLSSSQTATHHGYDGCVTLAITTYKRLDEFLGTVAGLQVGSFTKLHPQVDSATIESDKIQSHTSELSGKSV